MPPRYQKRQEKGRGASAQSPFVLKSGGTTDRFRVVKFTIVPKMNAIAVPLIVITLNGIEKSTTGSITSSGLLNRMTRRRIDETSRRSDEEYVSSMIRSIPHKASYSVMLRRILTNDEGTSNPRFGSGAKSSECKKAGSNS